MLVFVLAETNYEALIFVLLAVKSDLVSCGAYKKGSDSNIFGLVSGEPITFNWILEVHFD